MVATPDIWVVAAEAPQRVRGTRIGNRFFNATFTHHIASQVPSRSIAGICLPELGEITAPWSWRKRLSNRKHMYIDGHVLDREQLRSDIGRNSPDAIVVRGWGMRLEYLKEGRFAWQSRFARIAPPIDVATLNRRLVIHIRAGDALESSHPDYFPLPDSFYERIIDESGLEPLFVGQVNEQSWYVSALKQKFRGARFVGGTPMEDFSRLAHAENKVLSISSFAWVAAWMGDGQARTLVPRAGLFSPEVRPDIDLLPGVDEGFFEAKFPPVSRRDTESTQELLQHLGEFELPKF